MPVASPSGAPTPDPAPEGGEVLAAGRARGLAAKNRNQPQALELTSVSGAVKGPLRRALPALDSAINARNTAGHAGYAYAAAEVGRGPFHTKRHRPDHCRLSFSVGKSCISGQKFKASATSRNHEKRIWWDVGSASSHSRCRAPK